MYMALGGRHEFRIFYVSMKARRSRNAIRIQDVGDSKTVSGSDFESRISNFFKELYNKEFQHALCDWDFCDFILRLKEEDAVNLCKWVTC